MPEQKKMGCDREKTSGLNHVFALFDVADAELDVGDTPVVVFDDAVTDVNGISLLNILEIFCLVEGDGGDGMVGRGLLDEFEFEVAAIGAVSNYTASRPDSIRPAANVAW